MVKRDLFVKECVFKTSRSGGKGGQNVNKVETKVELIFNIRESNLFTDEQKQKLFEKIGSNIKGDQLFHITSEEYRSQWQNKLTAIEKAVNIIENALLPSKERKTTKPTKASKELRLKVKKINKLRKANRKKVSRNQIE